jgi:hypothetical protein
LSIIGLIDAMCPSLIEILEDAGEAMVPKKALNRLNDYQNLDLDEIVRALLLHLRTCRT